MSAAGQNDIILDFPEERLLPSLIEALREGFFEVPPGAVTEEEVSKIEADPEAYLASLNDNTPGEIELLDGTKVPKVPQECLWLSQGDEFIGTFNIRTELSPNLLENGGNLGYTIRPSYRDRGMATLGTKLSKDYAREKHGMSRLLVTCLVENAASERVIIKNGGIYEDTVEKPVGGFGPTKRFWIDLTAGEEK